MTQILKKGMKVVDLCDGCIHILDYPGKYPRRKDGGIDHNIEVMKEETLLNVPMPADEALKIIRNMFQSNRMIIMSITGTTRSNYRAEEVTEVFKIRSTSALDRIEFIGDITINSITPIIPTYSVGDEVMILATGEIGSIENQCKPNTAYYGVSFGNIGRNYHRSEICKIA